MLLQGLYGLIAQFVIAQCAHCNGIVTSQELACMIGEIGGSTTEFLSFREHIPQDFSESYYITFLIHIRIGLVFELKFNV